MLEKKILVQTKAYTVLKDGSCYHDVKEPLTSIIYDLALKYYNASKRISEVLDD